MEGLESYKTSLTPPLVIEVPVPSQESERSCLCVLRVCLCVLRVSIFPLFLPFNIFFIVFGTVSTVWYYLFYCFWNCFDSVVLFFFIVFGTVSTVWYYFFYCFWNCFDSVVLFFLFSLYNKKSLKIPKV